MQRAAALLRGALAAFAPRWSSILHAADFRRPILSDRTSLNQAPAQPVLPKFSQIAQPQSGCLYSYAVDNSTLCPFCTLPPERVLLRNSSAIAFRDAYPVSPGHMLVVPVRHLSSLFDATPRERVAMFSLLDAAKQQLQAEFSPAGYNIGVNDGAAAGQTVGHVHIHLIPRYAGDQPDPRGGVRWVFPEKADYWTGRA